ncbi:MAG TPA: DUF695 domain-containing protein [Candidatus Eisenbacteria bacterium]|nr:DUF695 domain-containing protein [Candidatus Eisenbacteria bacterium]
MYDAREMLAGIRRLAVALVVLSGCSASPPSGGNAAAPSPETATEERWSVINDLESGHPRISRRNDSLRQIDRSAYATRLTVTVAFKHPTPDGMPEAEESFSLGTFEDTLATALTKDQRTKFAAVVTAEGHRDFIFYTSAPEEAGSLAHEVALRRPDLSFAIGSVADPQWSVYQGLGPRP